MKPYVDPKELIPVYGLFCIKKSRIETNFVNEKSLLNIAALPAYMVYHVITSLAGFAGLDLLVQAIENTI